MPLRAPYDRGMRPRSLRTVCTVGALSAIMALALTACGPTVVGPVTSAPTPTPTPTAVATDRPVARMTLGCNDLADSGVVQGALVAAVSPRNALAVQLAESSAIPSVAFIEALGGVGCLWSNGAQRFDDTGIDTGFVGAELAIIPNDNDQWARYREIYGVVDDREAYCYTGSQLVCILNTLVNGFWVQVTLTGSLDDPGADPASMTLRTAAGAVFDHISASVAASPAPAVREPFAPETLALPENCDDFISADRVEAVLGISTRSSPFDPVAGGACGPRR